MVAEPGSGEQAPVVGDRRALAEQLAWSLSAKLLAALLQIVVLVLLARSLAPERFGVVSTVIVVMTLVATTNGFGLMRQMNYHRARDRNHPDLPGMFAARLGFTWLSVALWLLGTLGGWLVTGSPWCAVLAPLAVWLLFEQTTTVWNGLSTADGNCRALFFSYLWRRGPVVALMLGALATERSVLWAWSLGLGLGGALSWLAGRSGQETWARGLLLRRADLPTSIDWELGFWWGQVGSQLRDLDVAAVAAVSAHAGGIFAFPARLINPMNMITQSAGQVLFPRVARRGGLTRRELVLVVAAGTVPVLLVAVATFLAAPWLPQLLGDGYADSVGVLRITSVTAVFVGITILVAVLLTAQSSEEARWIGYAAAIGSVAQVGAAALGTLLGGAVGAATAVLVTVVAATLLMCHRAWTRARRA